MHLIHSSMEFITPIRLRRSGMALIFTALIALGFVALPVRSVQAADGTSIKVLETTPDRILLEFVVDDYQLESVELNGREYHRVQIPGAAFAETPGAPQAPVIGTLVGVPSTNGITVRVVDSSHETLNGILLAPSPQYTAKDTTAEASQDSWVYSQLQESIVMDPAIYAEDAFYPTKIAEISMSGAMRDQLVAQVQFLPVQLNPVTGEMHVLRRIVAEVTWDSPVDAAQADRRPTSPAYEDVLRNTLLNYGELDRPQPSGPVQSTIVTADQLDTPEANQPELKVYVDADGFYRIGRQDLVDAGMNLSGMDPRLLQMHNLGTEIAIYVDGEEDGVFDADDYVLFYAEVKADVYTTENVYWLSVGTSNGKRMVERNGSPTGTAQIPANFPAHIHAEEDTFYWVSMPYPSGANSYFWEDRISPNTQGLPQSRTYTVTLGHVVVNGPKATVKVHLQGFTSLEHHTKIYVNDTEVDNQTWSGQVTFDHVAKFDSSLLHDGENLIRVEAVDAGASVDQLFVDWIEIDYTAKYIADADQLRFGVPAAGTYRIEVEGFTSSDIYVYEITDPVNPVLFTNVGITASAGKHTLRFKDTAAESDAYLAMSDDRFLSPLSIIADIPSAWKSSTNGADYIIITYADFYSNTLPLATHRSGQGKRVAVVKVDDLYDEFNYGVFNPKAIKNFLRYAYNNWQSPAPTYVLLVGDAYQDYRDISNSGTKNYVPSQLYNSQYGQTVSDNWFASIIGDDILPDMLIGRLSAETKSQVDDIVAKIIDYDQAPQTNWNEKVLLVADDNQLIYEVLSEDIDESLPYYYKVDKVYVKNYPPSTPKDSIESAIENGRVIVNYAGHGESYAWGKWNQEKEWIYRREDVQALDNAGKLPFVTIGNCLNGWFVRRSQDVSIAEVFQRKPESGAIAIFAATQLGTPPGHVALISELIDAIYQHDQLELGGATTAAKIGLLARSDFWGLLVETYVLFGDPATTLAIPTNYPYVESTTPADGASGVSLDQDIRIVFSKPMDTKTVSLAAVGAASPAMTPQWNAQNTEVTYTHADFEAGKAYQFTLSGQDLQGNQLGLGIAPSSWSFSVVNDTVAPTVALQTEQKSIAPGMLPIAVYLDFSEPMRTDSIDIILDPKVSTGLSVTWNSSADRATVSFSESADIVKGQSYTLSVVGGKDLAGNDLAESAQITFSVDARTYLPSVLR